MPQYETKLIEAVIQIEVDGHTFRFQTQRMAKGGRYRGEQPLEGWMYPNVFEHSVQSGVDSMLDELAVKAQRLIRRVYPVHSAVKDFERQHEAMPTSRVE
jgi:hypothetical protein